MLVEFPLDPLEFAGEYSHIIMLVESPWNSIMSSCLFAFPSLVEPNAQAFPDSDPSSFNNPNSIGLGQVLGFSMVF